eukprot:CFRG7512T1
MYAIVTESVYVLVHATVKICQITTNHYITCCLQIYSVDVMVLDNGDSTQRKWAASVLGVTFFAYAASYFLRKPFSIAKLNLQNDLGFSNTQLGMLDTAFLLPYSLVQIFLGNYGDKFGPRNLLITGLFGAAVSMFFYGSLLSTASLMFFMFLNGAFQALLWPNCVKSVAPWMSQTVRAKYYGVWGASPYVGGVLATALAVRLLESGGWRNCFQIPALIVFIVGLFNIKYLRSPSDVGVSAPNPAAVSTVKSDGRGSLVTTRSTREAMLIPGVLSASLSFFFIKLTRYALMMWLPLYLTKVVLLPEDTAGWLSLCFEVGGALSSPFAMPICAYAVNGRLVRGVAGYQIVMGCVLILFIMTSGWGNVMFMALCIALAGVCSNSCDMLLSGPISTDFGEIDGMNLQATIAGLINGVGCLGSVMQGLVIGGVSDLYGWEYVFYVIIVLSFAASVVLVPSFPVDDRIVARKNAELP